MSISKNIIRYFLIAFASLHSLAMWSTVPLFNRGETSYIISIPFNAKPEIQFAAKELQHYILKASGALLPIREQNSSDKYCIFLSADESNSEDFQYYSEGQNIRIHGLGGRGIINAIYDFLENELGIHWLTSETTIIPHIQSYTIRPIKREGKPAFTTRLNYYYDAIQNPLWCQYNRINSTNYNSNYPYAHVTWYGMHNFRYLLSEKDYFVSHPEFFSLKEGKRIKSGQLCLTNPDVLKIVVNSLKKIIRGRPTYTIYDVSQNDNNNFCQCDKCTEIIKKYGGHSGLNLWFVNQVADSIKKTFPDKLIGTFAYRYTRQAPKNIKARDNVVIRFCTFESCIIHGFSDCKTNTAFEEDLIQWSKITQHLEVWDYCVGFNQYIAPCPNFRALAERFCTYKRLSISGLLMEGNYEGPWGDFSELRQWIISKLMWNPYQDVDSLAHLFINAYYSDAAPYIWDFYQLTQNQVQSTTHFPIYADFKNPVYTDDYIRKSNQIIERARLISQKDSVLSARVARVAAQVYYLEATRHSSIDTSRINARNRLSDIIKKDSTYFMEYHKNMTLAFKILGI